MTPEARLSHIVFLSQELGVFLDYAPHLKRADHLLEGFMGFYFQADRKVMVNQRPTTEIAYAGMLHELGHAATLSANGTHSHLLNLTDSARSAGIVTEMVLEIEVVAWDWAQRNAKEWTPKMAAARETALDTYRNKLWRY